MYYFNSRREEQGCPAQAASRQPMPARATGGRRHAPAAEENTMRSWASHRTTRARRLLLGTAAPASLLLLLGCTAHAPMTATTSAAPVTRQAPEHSALVDR